MEGEALATRHVDGEPGPGAGGVGEVLDGHAHVVVAVQGDHGDGEAGAVPTGQVGPGPARVERARQRLPAVQEQVVDHGGRYRLGGRQAGDPREKAPAAAQRAAQPPGAVLVVEQPASEPPRVAQGAAGLEGRAVPGGADTDDPGDRGRCARGMGHRHRHTGLMADQDGGLAVGHGVERRRQRAGVTIHGVAQLGPRRPPEAEEVDGDHPVIDGQTADHAVPVPSRLGHAGHGDDERPVVAVLPGGQRVAPERPARGRPDDLERVGNGGHAREGTDPGAGRFR